MKEGTVTYTYLTQRLQKVFLDGGFILARKIFQGSYSAGLPDVIMCVHGNSIWWESKKITRDPTPLQLENLKNHRKAGGISILAVWHEHQWNILANVPLLQGQVAVDNPGYNKLIGYLVAGKIPYRLWSARAEFTREESKEFYNAVKGCKIIKERG